MADNEQRNDRNESDAIEQRILDERRNDQEEIVGAAREGFEEDQRDPDHPTRIKRRSGVEDPSHSKGTPRVGGE